METRASYILVGAFVLVLAVGTVAFALWIAQIKSADQFAYYDIHIDGAVSGLEVGSKVQRQGIEVGRVANVALLERDGKLQVRVSIEVLPEPAVKADAEARLQRSLLTNLAFIQIGGGSAEADPLPVVSKPGQESYPEIPYRSVRQLTTAIDLGAQLIEEMRGHLDELLSAENKKNLGETIKNISVISASLADPTGEVQGLMKDIRQLTQTLDQTMGEMESLLSEVRSQTAVLGEENFAKDLARTVRRFDKTAASVSDAANQVTAFLDNVDDPIQEFSTAGLYELTRALTDLRELINSWTRITANIERDPANFLLGSSRQGYQVQQ